MNNSYILNLASAILISLPLHASLITIETEEQFNAEVLANPKPVVAKFAASWCSVCQEVKEPFAQVAVEPEFENIVFAQIDIDQLAALSDNYDINAVPTIIFFQSGNKKLTEVGVKDIRRFKEKLRTNIHNAFDQNPKEHDPIGSLKRAENESSFLGTVVASLKSAYSSMLGAVSSAWNRLVS